jgi:Cytochrome P450
MGARARGCWRRHSAGVRVNRRNRAVPRATALPDILRGQLAALQNANMSEVGSQMSDAVGQLGRSVQAPQGYPPGPVGECTPAFLRDPLHFLRHCRAAYGPLATLTLGGQRVVLVSGSGAAAAVLLDSASQPQFCKEGTAFFPTSSLAGNGLLVSDGEMWRRQRRLSNPAFRQAAVRCNAGAAVTWTCRNPLEAQESVDHTLQRRQLESRGGGEGGGGKGNSCP